MCKHHAQKKHNFAISAIHSPICVVLSLVLCCRALSVRWADEFNFIAGCCRPHCLNSVCTTYFVVILYFRQDARTYTSLCDPVIMTVIWTLHPKKNYEYYLSRRNISSIGIIVALWLPVQMRREADGIDASTEFVPRAFFCRPYTLPDVKNREWLNKHGWEMNWGTLVCEINNCLRLQRWFAFLRNVLSLFLNLCCSEHVFWCYW